MVLDKFGTHVSKRVHKHVKKKISAYIKSKTFKEGVLNIKKIPANEDDLVNLKYLSKIITNLELTWKTKIDDFMNQKLFVFENKVDDKISKPRSLLLINLILKLDGDNYKLENGNSFYVFPCNGTVKKIKYNIERLLIETKLNDKSLSLEGQSVSENDKLTFLPIKGQKIVNRLSVEILLETNLKYE